jgi:hypothetical protein
MKTYDRVPSKIEIPGAVEIELEEGEYLYAEMDIGLWNPKMLWMPVASRKFKIVKDFE